MNLSLKQALAIFLAIFLVQGWMGSRDAEIQSREIIRVQIVDKNKILHRRDALLIDGVAMVGLDGK
jgi:hypothetical protein